MPCRFSVDPVVGLTNLRAKQELAFLRLLRLTWFHENDSILRRLFGETWTSVSKKSVRPLPQNLSITHATVLDMPFSGGAVC